VSHSRRRRTITQSSDKSSTCAPFHVANGLNPFSTDKECRYPGMPTAELNCKKNQGEVYQTASGGITPVILEDVIKTV